MRSSPIRCVGESERRRGTVVPDGAGDGLDGNDAGEEDCRRRCFGGLFGSSSGLLDECDGNGGSESRLDRGADVLVESDGGLCGCSGAIVRGD